MPVGGRFGFSRPSGESPAFIEYEHESHTSEVEATVYRNSEGEVLIGEGSAQAAKWISGPGGTAGTKPHFHDLLVIEKSGEFGEGLTDGSWRDAGPAGYFLVAAGDDQTSATIDCAGRKSPRISATA